MSISNAYVLFALPEPGDETDSNRNDDTSRKPKSTVSSSRDSDSSSSSISDSHESGGNRREREDEKVEEEEEGEEEEGEDADDAIDVENMISIIRVWEKTPTPECKSKNDIKKLPTYILMLYPIISYNGSSSL